ncbi:MAG TPA: hypothetical protein PKK26_02770 [Candidatus Wallbacteria bacterium]|nr:hypothetical protein [Candidatus Wallbacteria bacterium]
MTDDKDKTPPASQNANVKSIWQKSNPFGKFESKKIHRTQEDEDREKAEIAAAAKKAEPKVEEILNIPTSELTEEQIDVLKKKGKLPTVIKVVDFTGSTEGALIKILISVRNCGDALARDVKVKCIGNARLRAASSPMAPVGDIVTKSKGVAQFTYEMPNNFCEEYANFAVSAEAENSKTFSQLFTVKTGRRPLSASEIMQKVEAEARGQNKVKPPVGGG